MTAPMLDGTIPTATTRADADEIGVQLFDMTGEAGRRAFEALRRSGAVTMEVDALPELLEDLFRLEFPFIPATAPAFAPTFHRYVNARWNGGDVAHIGVWAYIPWRQSAVHLPDADAFQRLRTARNRFLVSDEAQQAFHDARVGVAGLSVGLSIVTAIVLSGGAGRLRVADEDVLSLTNFNRLLGSVCQLGQRKTTLCARRMLEINPFQTIDAYAALTDENIASFMGEGDAQLDLFIEEMDDVRMKVMSRFAARERRIPVIMAADDSDSSLVDVERFDLEPERPLFHGALDEDYLRTLPEQPSTEERVHVVSAMIGSEVGPRTQLSFREVGGRIPQWSQLATGATVSGAALTFVARRILSGEPMPSGRYSVNLDHALDVEFHTPAAATERARVRAEFLSDVDVLLGARA